MDFASFFALYFVNPICFQQQYAPYNVYNTAAYAILALAGAYAVFLAIKKLGVRVSSERFFWAVMPFVVFGAAMRVLEDAALLPRCVELFGVQNFPLPFTSPGIYLLVFLILALCFAASLFWKKGDVEKALEMSGKKGAILAGATLLFFFFGVGVKNWVYGAGPLAIALSVFLVFKIAWKKSMKEEPDLFASAAFFSQAFDGVATFVGTTFAGYGEQHVVGNAVIDFFGGSWAFFLLKIAFAFAVVWVAKKEFSNGAKDREQRAFVLLLIAVMGLAPGLRDILRIMAGV